MNSSSPKVTGFAIHVGLLLAAAVSPVCAQEETDRVTRECVERQTAWLQGKKLEVEREVPIRILQSIARDKAESRASSESDAQRAYAMNCAACHYSGGKLLTSPTPLFQANLSDSDRQRLIDAVLFGKANMPAFTYSFSANDLANLLTFIVNVQGNAQLTQFSAAEIACSYARVPTTK